MPLRVPAGVPIRPARRRPPAVGVAAAPPVLRVPYVAQTQTQWCWAAVAEMVARHLGNTAVKQCELANVLHGQAGCCTSPASPACNQPVADHAGVHKVYAHLRIASKGHEWAVGPQVLLKELTAGRPVEVGYQWHGGTAGHVALVYGLTADGLWAVHDPWPDFGSGVATYPFLLTAYGMGRWRHTFGDFRPLAP